MSIFKKLMCCVVLSACTVDSDSVESTSESPLCTYDGTTGQWSGCSGQPGGGGGGPSQGVCPSMLYCNPFDGNSNYQCSLACAKISICGVIGQYDGINIPDAVCM